MFAPKLNGVSLPARQAYSHSTSVGRPAPGQERLKLLQEILHVVPAHLLHRPLLVPGEMARVRPHHRAPHPLGAGAVGQPETARQRHRVARPFIVKPLRLILRRAHQKGAGLDPAQSLHHPFAFRVGRQIKFGPEPVGIVAPGAGEGWRKWIGKAVGYGMVVTRGVRSASIYGPPE